jgi:GTP-binding protein HflX
MLILQIFAQRARSHEGKLQVELARLQYLSTRLVRRWSHLERQQGGIGTRGGPGERQIELDRRMIGECDQTHPRATRQKVKRQRATQRRQRQRNATFAISLVGYTNAGKSTLFNALVKARAYAADQLFATLDTTTRQLYLPQIGRFGVLCQTRWALSATLPHGLVDAFEATLQEAVDADLLLHVVDAASPHWAEQITEVQRVLAEIGAGDVEQILVFNKIDAMPPQRQPERLQDSYAIDGKQVPRIYISAHQGQGLDALREAIARAAVSTTDQAAAGWYSQSPDGDLPPPEGGS